MDDLSFNPDLITPETQDKFFYDLPLDPILITLFKHFNFIHPTPIQFKSIPLGLNSRNIIAQSKAGTGKTLAYTSVVLNKLVEKNEKFADLNEKRNVEYLVLSPTRELAIQIHKFFNRFFTKGQQFFKNSYKAGLCIGGLPVQDIKNSLRMKQFDVIVGTLGRICELIKEKSLDLRFLEIIVLDEADKLFNPENLNNTVQILNIIQKTAQILAFSATFTTKNLEKIKELMPNPEEIFILPSIKRKAENPLNEEDIQNDLNLVSICQMYLEIPGNESIYLKKTQALIKLLQTIKFSQCLVFYNEKSRGEELSTDLKEEGFDVTFIHGDQSQSDRIKVMNRLSLSKVNILVSTDLLSRGIDILDIDLVVNYDLPKKIETYFHRIGRTGRYGKKGAAVILMGEEERGFIEKNSTSLGNLVRLNSTEEIAEKANEFISIKSELGENKKKKKKREGFFEDNCLSDLKWIEKTTKNQNEEQFIYFQEQKTETKEKVGGLECLECKICKEFLEKTQEILNRKFEILKFFKV